MQADGNLSEIRMEVLEAVNAFLAHIKYTITLMITLLAASVAVAAFALEVNDANLRSSLTFISQVGLFLLIPISLISWKICRRFYKMYASFYIYYARTHLAREGVEEHPWVQDLFDTQGFNIKSLKSRNAVTMFMGWKRGKESTSWAYYQPIILVFAVIGAVGLVYLTIIANGMSATT